LFQIQSRFIIYIDFTHIAIAAQEQQVVTSQIKSHKEYLMQLQTYNNTIIYIYIYIYIFIFYSPRMVEW